MCAIKRAFECNSQLKNNSTEGVVKTVAGLNGNGEKKNS